MSLNWKEIDAVLDELALTGSRIQKVRQPNYHDLLLDLYGSGVRRTVLISLEQGRTRIHEATIAPKSEVGLQRFAQLLRSRITGGVITEAGQIGEDRIVHMVITRGEERTDLYARLWSGAANIIAVDEDGEILDAFYRRPNRGEISGNRYDPLEAIGKTGTKKRRQFEVRDFPPVAADTGTAAGSAAGAPGAGTDDRARGESLSARIEGFYQGAMHEDQLTSLRERLRGENEREAARAESALRDIDRQLQDAEAYEDFKHFGDLLASNLHRVMPRSTSLKVQDFSDPEREIEIELDPSLSPGENADRYYRRYKKEKSRLDRLESERASLERRLDGLRHDLEAIEYAGDVEALERLAGDRNRSKRPEGRDDRPGLEFETGGYRILVGRSAKENDVLLRGHVRGNDVWLHTRFVPGSHVFIKTTPGKSVPLDVLLDAGNLAVFYSKAKNDGGADLYYTYVKYLRRAKHGQTGTVLPTQEKNLSIRIEEDRLARLFAGRSKT